MKKRIVAIVMSLMMLAGSAPVSLYAASPAGTTGSTAEAVSGQDAAGTAAAPAATGTGQTDTTSGEAAQTGTTTGTTEQASSASDPAQTTKDTETTPKDNGTETTASTETESETETETETEEKEKTEEEKWLEAHGLKKNADGMYEYTDDNGVLWTYDPEDPELFRLFSEEKDLGMEFAPLRKRGVFSAQAEEDPYYWRLNGNFRFQYPSYYATDSIENRAAVHYGLDVSSHQGVIPASSWETLSNIYGIDFVFVRAGFRGYGESGSLNMDAQAVTNVQNAAKAGLAVGVYYYSQAITTQEAVAEADDCMRIIAPCKELITLPVVIDYEYAGSGLGRLANAHLSRQAHTDIVNAFCKRVQDNGYRPGIYANVDMLKSDMVLSGIPSENKIWMANWPTANSEGIFATKYADRLSAWQYTGSFTGFGSGVGGTGLFQSDKVDLNFWYGDFEEQETFTEARITTAKAVSTPDPQASATDTKANKIISVEVEAELPGKMNGSDGKVYLATVNQVTGAVEYVIPSSAVDCPSKSETVTISIPLDRDFKTGYYRQCDAIRVEGGANKAAHLRLYLNKLALAVKNADGTYSAVSEGKYVSNPEAISYTSDYQSTSSKKGIQSADHIVGDGIDATTGLANNDLGVSHVFLNLYVSDVLDAANGPLGAYEYNGETYYFSSLGSYLNTIRRCNDAGIAVTLQVMLDDPSKITDPGGTYNRTFQQWMIHSKAQSSGKMLYSWENNERAHREVTEAAFSYIGEAFGTLAAKDLGGKEGKPVPERESTQVFVSDWVLGNEVNSCDAWQYRGSMTDDEFFESYAQTYRTFYNAIRSVNSDARVYICTDNAWNQRVAGFTAKETVDRVAGLLKEYDPTTDWNLAFHPYPHPLGATAFWTNADVTGSVSTPFINMSNLKVLTDYISNTYGSSHRIILSEQGFSSGNGENMQAAALVHAYYLAATNPMIDAFEIRSYEDEKLEVLQGTTMGLTSRKNGGYAMKEAYTAYKYCDDPRAEAKKFMDEHAYYKVVNSSAAGWGDVSNPYYDASTFDAKIYRTVPEPPAEPEEPEEPEEPAVPSTCTVSFDTNGGAETIASQTVTEGETATKPEDPTRSGYTFVEWVNPEGVAYDFAAPVDGNLTLKAIWEAKTDTPYTIEHYKANVDGSYPKTPTETEKVTGTTDTDTAASAKTYEGFTAQNVQQQKISGDGKTVIKIYYTRNQVTLWFDSKGGTAIQEFKGPYGSAVSKPADPERPGYTFKGWEPAIPSQMPSEDLTLTAQWQVNTYTVTFDTEGGSPAIASQTVEYEKKAEKPSDPKKAGYDFVQWLDEEGCGYDFDSPVTEDVNLTAQWTEGQTDYTVEHYLEKKDQADSYELDADATVRMRGTTGKKTEAVAKSYTGFTANSFAQETIAADGSTVVKIYYQRAHVTLQFMGAEQKTHATLNGTYQSDVNAPTDPTRDGYTFMGWDQPVPETFPAEDRIFTATWSPNTDTAYHVEHYKANTDGTYPTVPSETEQLTGTTGGLTSASVKAFEGFTAQSVHQESIRGDGKTVVRIYYTRNQVTLHFDSAGGTAVSEIRAPYGSEITPPADPRKTGYTFTGWDPAVPDRMSAEDLTVTAQWAIDSYTVTFDTAGGSPAIADQKVEYQKKAEKPADPKKQGYDFVQWLDDRGYGYDFNTGVKEDLALTAQWTAGETGYTVEHYLEQADKAGEYEIDVNATSRMLGTTGTKTAATAKTYAGFTSEGVTQQTINADGSTVVRIYYRRNRITLQFCDENGEVLSTLRGSYGQSITMPDTPQRDGYTFTGWGQSVPEAFPAEDRVYTASWTPNTDTPYTVKHYRADLNGIYAENLCETETGLTGTTGTATAAAARSYDGFTAQTVQQKTITGDGRTIVKIYYTRNQTTLHFDSKGGSAVSDRKGPYESAVSAPADPVRTGYTFLGWSPSVPEKMPLSDQTFTAQWKINTYAVKFDTAGGASAIPAQDVEYQKRAIRPEDPKKQGYTFVQWLDAEKKGYDFNTPVTNELTLTAQWTEGKTGYTVEHFLEKADEAGAYELDDTVKMTGTTGQKTEAVAKTYTGFVAKSFVQETIAADGSTTVKIYYNRNTVTLKFLGEGQNPVATLTGKYQDKVSKPADPERKGYRFTGWDSVIPGTFPAEDVTFTATWEPVDCSVKFFDEDGTLLGAYVLKYDTPATGIPVPATPQKEKDVQYTYTFRTWAPDLQTVTGDISYQASYDKKENAYQITFTDGLGRTLSSSEVVYGNTPKAPADPKRTGYEFTGFTPAITPVTGDQIYRAMWKPVSYQITYDLAGGENAATNPAAYTIENTEITFATPKKAGYHFEKWVDENGRTISSIPTGSTGDRKVKAVWTKAITYPISYDLAGGQNAPENPAYYTVESGEWKLAEPKRTGYTFEGWTGTDLTTPAKTVTIPAKSTGERSYTATWSRNSYTVKFDRADGSANPVTTETVAYGDPITMPANPSREGYDFTGWSAAIPSAMPDRDLTLTAQWKIRTYQVVFMDNNGNTLQSQNVEYGRNTSYTGDVPKCEGKLFIGWSLNGQTDTRQLKQLHDDIINVIQEYRYQAVYTDAPAATPTLTGAQDTATGERNGAEVSGTVTLDNRETTALQAFDSTALTPALVKQDEVLAAVASECAKQGKNDEVQNITRVALEINTKVTGKSGNGKQAVYVLEITPYAVAKAGNTTVIEAKLDHEALRISDGNRMQVKIPVLMNILFARILHYMEDNSTVRETFNVPVQESDGERFAAVSLGCFSKFTVEEGAAAPATVIPGAATGGSASGTASADHNSANASAPLSGEVIPAPDLTFAQKTAIEMAALQEKAASGGSWIANLFGLGSQDPAAANHAAASAQNTPEDASRTAETREAAESDESSFRTEEPGEATALTDDLRTADVDEMTDAGTGAETAASAENGNHADASEDHTTGQQKETKPWVIPLIIVLAIAGAAILVGLVLLRTRSHRKRHRNRK